MDDHRESVLDSAYNHVVLDPSRDVVTKTFRQGDVVSRYENELAALQEVPSYSRRCRVPTVLASGVNGQPWIKMRYLPAKGTLADLLEQEGVQGIRDNVASYLHFMGEVHHSTNGTQAIPEGLAQRIASYLEKYSEHIEPDLQGRVEQVSTTLPEMAIARVHQDFKLKNMLYDGEGPAGLLDWEHYGDGAMVYDPATLLVNTLIHLYAADRLPEADQLEEMFTDYLANHGPETLHQVYIAAVARTLVEFSPVVKRQELGKREDHRPFMNRLLRLTLDYAEQPRELRQFLRDASRLERNGS